MEHQRKLSRWTLFATCLSIELEDICKSVEDDHMEVIKKAKELYHEGQISRMEFEAIVEADIKYRSLKATQNVSPSIDDVSDEHRDPISLELLGPHIFTFISPTGKEVSYNVSSIANYLLKSGDMIDPVTRCKYSHKDIERLDETALAAGISCTSLVTAIEKKEIYESMKLRYYEIKGLEACLGEIIVEMLNIIEKSDHRSRREDDVNLTILFTEFCAPFNELKKISVEEAYQSLSSWKLFLSGPSKKPNRNKSGLLQHTLDFLDSQWTNADKIRLDEIRISI